MELPTPSLLPEDKSTSSENQRSVTLKFRAQVLDVQITAFTTFADLKKIGDQHFKTVKGVGYKYVI